MREPIRRAEHDEVQRCGMTGVTRLCTSVRREREISNCRSPTRHGGLNEKRAGDVIAGCLRD